MSDVSFVKLQTSILSDEKLSIIDSWPDGNGLLYNLVWLRLLALAGRQNNRGVFLIAGEIPMTPAMLAASIHVPAEIVENALEIFVSLRMMETDENGAYLLANWEIYQNVDGMEKHRDQTRARVQALRERRRAEAKPECAEAKPDCAENVPETGEPVDGLCYTQDESVTECNGNGDVTLPVTPCNVTVTQCNADVTHTEYRDKNTEKEKDNISSSPPYPPSQAVGGGGIADAVRDEWEKRFQRLPDYRGIVRLGEQYGMDAVKHAMDEALRNGARKPAAYIGACIDKWRKNKAYVREDGTLDAGIIAQTEHPPREETPGRGRKAGKTVAEQNYAQRPRNGDSAAERIRKMMEG